MFSEHFDARRRAREQLGLEAGAATWPKEHHLERIRASGWFQFAREVVCHGWGKVDAAGVVGLAESVGGPRNLFGGAAPEVDRTFRRLEEVGRRVLGEATWPMVVCYRLRLALK